MGNKPMNGGFSVPTIDYRRVVFLRHAKNQSYNHSPGLLNLSLSQAFTHTEEVVSTSTWAHGDVSKCGT